MKKINVYLVDDHSLFREGLRFLLSNLDFVDEIHEAENGEQFIAQLKQKPADIALLDIEMPVMNGIVAAHQAIIIQPSIKVLALSMYSDENYYVSMIEAGAHGFLLKNSNFAEVKKAVTDVLNDRNYFSLEILQAMSSRVSKGRTIQTNTDLTDREIEVLFHVCKGLSNPEIAGKLKISKRTVDKHRENLLLKTASKNTANLVIFAVKNGYFSI